MLALKEHILFILDILQSSACICQYRNELRNARQHAYLKPHAKGVHPAESVPGQIAGQAAEAQ
jgi:hypothetical protein